MNSNATDRAPGAKAAPNTAPRARRARARPPAASTSTRIVPTHANGASDGLKPWVWMAVGAIGVGLLGGALLRRGWLGRLGTLAFASGVLGQLRDSAIGTRARQLVRLPLELRR